MIKRKTSDDYRKELKRLEESLASLDIHITNRLLELVTIHPDAIINSNYLGIREDIKAKSLTKCYVDTLSMVERIDYIGVIEKWSLEAEGIIQKKIEI